MFNQLVSEKYRIFKLDLKRLNREEPFKKDILHTVGEYRYSLPANDERYVLPLPPAVISANPSIPVYPR